MLMVLIFVLCGSVSSVRPLASVAISDRNDRVGQAFDIFIGLPSSLQGVVGLCHLLDVGLRLVESFRDWAFGDVANDLLQRLLHHLPLAGFVHIPRREARSVPLVAAG